METKPLKAFPAFIHTFGAHYGRDLWICFEPDTRNAPCKAFFLPAALFHYFGGNWNFHMLQFS